MYTRRATRDSTIPDRQSIGADFMLATNRFRGSQNLQLNAYYMKTPDGVINNDNWARGIRLLYPNDRWSGRVVYKEIRENFDPAVGFIERSNSRELVYRTKFAPRPKNSRVVRQAGAEVWADLFMDTSGHWTDRDMHYIFDISMQSGDTANFQINPVYTRLESLSGFHPALLFPAGSNTTTCVIRSISIRPIEEWFLSMEPSVLARSTRVTAAS